MTDGTMMCSGSWYARPAGFDLVGKPLVHYWRKKKNDEEHKR